MFLATGGARKALISWVILGMEFKHISFKSSEKKHPSGSLCVRENVNMPGSCSPWEGQREGSLGLFC